MGQSRFDPKQLGRAGEQRARNWYLSNGYELLEANWRCPDGEIDLILTRGDCVVFAEVKTRTSDRYGTPFQAVDSRKQRKLRQLIGQWLKQNPSGAFRTIRIDVVAVVGTTVEVREGVV
ncbi:MAG: YraN family protein [Microthrixaceae bacterium]|nr:YraN family protein [Microthrixaceae bacterium]